MRLTTRTFLVLAALLSINTANYSMATNPFKKIFKSLNGIVKLFSSPKKKVVIPVVVPAQQNSQQSTGNNSVNSMEAADQNNSLSSHRNSNLNETIDMEEAEGKKAGTQLTKEEISKYLTEKVHPIETNTEVTTSDPKLKDKIPGSPIPNSAGEENEMKD